ncbi:WAT1-related protein At5g40210-like [Gastrolobium bilobum]|uniref:WAT1-related protein At5g40210-like n=1 Tax=Gastrolobium bilobum TaxID=150636 RepID=UPI002AB20238|nr:WAT1-related protein At5g40210-like [Gastrolobium bilobum]
MVSGEVSVTAAMVAAQFLEVGLNTLIKAATNNGMSNYVFVVYSNLLALCFLLPSTLLYHRKRAPPPIPTSILCTIFLLSCLSTAVQTLMYNGIGYSSPTLASAMVDLVPAFTFILAVIFRMENLNLKLHSCQAKVIGTVVSIAGALIVTLYKGVPLTSGPLRNIVMGGSGSYLSVQSFWLLGGFLLAIASFCLSVLFIVQTWIIKNYPEELVVTTICCSFVVVLSAIVALIAEGDPKAWVFRTDKEFVAVCYAAIFVVSMRSVVFTWACRKKGPVYVAMFNPLGMVIALGTGLIFLGDNLYLGSLIGAATIAIGFYAVMWAQAQEENVVNKKEETYDSASTSTTPLLSAKSTGV